MQKYINVELLEREANSHLQSLNRQLTEEYYKLKCEYRQLENLTNNLNLGNGNIVKRLRAYKIEYFTAGFIVGCFLKVLFDLIV